MDTSENIVDDKGTTHEEAQNLLANFCLRGFDDDVEKTAFVLGRSGAEITDFINGDEVIDDDLVMKIRGIAQEREIEID